MAVKKATPVKKATSVKAKASPAKKTSMAVAAKAAPKKKVDKGDSYVCGVCGLAVTVDSCGRATMSDIICCGKPMKTKAAKTVKAKAPVKAAKVTKTAKKK
ncbi:MAG TPA: hypothetical protein DCX22_02670 [Dehalococcoidia bacterium]|nr:hypothetical protein [Dehalococcoidia bacterium]